MRTTWRGLLTETMGCHGESLQDVVANTMSESEMDVQFDSGFGEVEGIPFTAWTEKRVYFPVKYDGSESVSSVARFPDGIPTMHIGMGG